MSFNVVLSFSMVVDDFHAFRHPRRSIYGVSEALEP